MPEEAFVFRGEHRIDHMPRHFFESKLVAETLRDARFAQRNPISIEQRNALHGRAQQGGWHWDEAETEMPRDEGHRQCDQDRSGSRSVSSLLEALFRGPERFHFNGSVRTCIVSVIPNRSG